MAHSILLNTAFASLGRLSSAALGIVATALLTRYLGAAGFGFYSLLLAYGALLLLAADFGLYLTLTREIAKNPQQETHILSHIISLRLALLLLVFIIGGAVLLLIPSWREVALAFFIVALGLSFQSLSQLLMGVYQKYSVVWRVTVGDLVGRLVQIVGIVLLWPLAVGLVGMVSMFTFGAASAFLLHQRLLPIYFPYRFKFNRPTWHQLLRVSWPLGAMLVLNAIYFRVDTLILSFFRTPAEVGHYGFAYRLIESGLFFPAMFGGLLLPRLTAAWQAGKIAHCRRLLSESLHVITIAVVLVLIFLQMTTEQLVLLIAGPGYEAAGPLLRVVSLALASMFFGNIFGFTLVALDKQKMLLILYAMLVVGNVLANLATIPLWGALAAAWTTVATEIIATVTAGAWVYRSIGYHYNLRLLVRIAGAALATICLLLIFPPTVPVWLQLMMASVFYVACNIILRSLTRQQLTLLLTPASS
ncbi:MAG: flippase [Candidatus Andersenbacteria bacterium]